MYQKIFIFFTLFIILFISGCINNENSSFQESQQVDNLNETWILKTINRIDDSEGIEGGYSEFSPEEPTLYSTYYFLESLKLLDKKPEHKQATIDWLFSEEQKMLNENGSANIRDIYFLTMSLDTLGVNQTNSSGLISKVMELQTSDGSFSEKEGDKGTLLDTFRAITVLRTLGVDLNQVAFTKAWLINKWMDSGENETPQNLISDTSMLREALELYDVNVSSTQYQSPRMEQAVEQKNIVENQLESLPDTNMDFFTLSLFTDFLLRNGSIPPELRSDISKYLQEKQLQDGGFNAFLDSYGESQGTYLALKTASDIGVKLDGNISEFIYNHEPLDGRGGFHPAYRMISSPENTYLAVKALNILDSEPANKEKLHTFLESQWQTDSQTDFRRVKNYYSLLMTYGLLNQEPPQDEQLKVWVKNNLDEVSNQPVESMDLEEVLYLAKLANIFDIELNNRALLVTKLQTLQQKDGGFGFEASDLFITYYIVNVLEELNASPLDREACIAWIQEGQSEDGGFIIRRGLIHTNSSDIYSTYRSVISLNALGAKPKDSSKLLKWLNDCQAEYGGFKFAPEYADLDVSENGFEASLESTSWGLMVWRTLSDEQTSKDLLKNSSL